MKQDKRIYQKNRNIPILFSRTLLELIRTFIYKRIHPNNVNKLSRLKSYKYLKDSYNNKTHIKTVLLSLVVVMESVLYVGSSIMSEIYTELKLNAEYRRRRNDELRTIYENSRAEARGQAIEWNITNRQFQQNDRRKRNIERQERQYAKTFTNIANGKDNFMGGKKRW